MVDKWKNIPKKLRDDGLISDAPNLGETYWEEWLKLVDYRNGLIHAQASRPETKSQPKEEKPLPSKTILEETSADWAVRPVVNLVRRLHDAAGMSPPTWLKEP